LDLKPYRLEFMPGWDRHFKGFDSSQKNRILSKLEQMKQPLRARGLHSSKFRVEEAGGYRIGFKEEEADRVKIIHFVGTHKQYQDWYSTL
jgi:hypothetical protein